MGVRVWSGAYGWLHAFYRERREPLVGNVVGLLMRRSLTVAALALSLFASGATASLAGERTAELELSMLAKKVAKVRTETWKCQDAAGTQRTKASVSSWALPPSVSYRRWVSSRWATLRDSCQAKQAEIKRQWAWRSFPQWIIDLGVCESGGSGGAAPGEPNWYAEGRSSDGTFFSAFNISRSVYDRDAHHMGVRGWNEGPGIPSPYEQAMAVIGHVRLYGDGFTGRCAGIARSSWN